MSDSIERIKCLIIGSGPAGYTAAIYAARANMKPVLYQGSQPGGQLTTTNEVENFPGYPEGVTGPEMMMQLKAQAERFDTDVRDGWITKVDFSGDVHKVWVNDEKEIHSDTIIISTGASAKYLGLDSEQKYLKQLRERKPLAWFGRQVVRNTTSASAARFHQSWCAIRRTSCRTIYRSLFLYRSLR